jgi:hypothetical protein
MKNFALIAVTALAAFASAAPQGGPGVPTRDDCSGCRPKDLYPNFKCPAGLFQNTFVSTSLSEDGVR